MRLLLDQGLPRSSVAVLESAGISATHTSDLGLSHAADCAILEFARTNGFEVVVTLDADFHTAMALSGAMRPSVIRIRMEGVRAPALAMLLETVLARCGDDLQRGALVSVEERRIRVRLLPIAHRS